MITKNDVSALIDEQVVSEIFEGAQKESKVLSNIENNVIPNINRKLNNLSNQYKDLKIKEQLESEVNINV